MADEVKAPGSAEASASQQGGAAPAGSVPSVEDLQKQLAQAKAAEVAAKTAADLALKQHKELEVRLGKQSQELGALRQMTARNGTEQTGETGQGEMDQRVLMDSLTLLTAFRTDPRYAGDYNQNWQAVDKMISEDPALQQMDVFTRHVTALERVKAVNATAAQTAALSEAEKYKVALEEANKKLETVEKARQIMAGQAVVSGVGAAVPPENVNVDEIMKMPAAERLAYLEKTFGKDALMRGVI